MIHDTGEAFDTGDTGEYTYEPSDEGQPSDSSDEFQHYWGDECNHKSASELAGETGGVSCSHAAAHSPLLLMLAAMIIYSRTRAKA
ncbi:MAG TPA: hypothetical protein EYN27_11510 [Rhodospirillales bacterium]|nr:hypothetical protein [Rhodospirillales bacterium]HIO39562.1 hypothetical protein [Rhodospirillales bacterium]